MNNIFKKKIKKCYYCSKPFENKKFEGITIYRKLIGNRIILEFPLFWLNSCDKCRKYQKYLAKKEFDKRVNKEIKKLNEYIMTRDLFLKNEKNL